MKNKNVKHISASRSIITSISVSVSDIVLNLIIALISGSSVMFSQALQGTADLTTAVLLLIGVKRSSKKADKLHPFGFGREIFFWTLLASIFAFAVTGGIAVYRGVNQILDQSTINNEMIALGMLVFGLLTNAYSMHISVRRLGASIKHVGTKQLLQRIFHSSMVETKTTLLVDMMGTLSAAVGLIALSTYVATGNSLFDGIGATIVGLMTMSGAALLIYNLKDFIIGRSPHPEMITAITESAKRVKGVNDVLDLRAVSIGSGKVLVIIEVHFKDNLSTDQIEAITDKVKDSVKTASDSIVRVQVEAETPDLAS